MQDGCKVYMDPYMASNGSCFMVTWTFFQNPLLGGRPDTKPRDHDSPERSQPIIYSILSCVRVRVNTNILK